MIFPFHHKANHKIWREEGYTLIETVVAMALFLSVLIPLITIMGNVMLDRKAKLSGKALALAVTEMNTIADSKVFIDACKTTEDGFVVERIVKNSAPIIEVEVAIKTAGESPKEILTLRRTFLVYQ
jgi:type II secretory pathway pseudopilin PulG